MTIPVPGVSPASVLAAALTSGTGPLTQGLFSTTGFPFLPSLVTEGVWLPADAIFECNFIINGTLQSLGWATGNVTTVTANYTALGTDAVILASATSGAFTVTLPDLTGLLTGQRYTVIKSDSSASAVTVTGTSGQALGGATSVTLPRQYTGVSVVSDGTTAWWPTPGTAPVTASANFKPSNPTGTTSATLVMMGTGSTCAYTPISTGRVRVDVTGQMGQQTAVAINTVGGRYGTGTAPANGVAVTGTRFGGSQDASIRPSVNSTSSTTSNIAFTDILALTAGTAYWFDLALATGSTSDQVYLQNLSVTVQELSS